MRKLVALLLLLVLMFMAACSNADTPSTGSSQEGESNQESANNEQAGGSVDEIEIEFWHIHPGAREEVFLEAVARFEENNPGVKVNVQRIANDNFKQRLIVSMSGGNPPDIFHNWGGGWLKQFVDSGQVLDLTAYIDVDHYLETAIDNVSFGDGIYGAPLGLGLHYFFYNTEIFEEYGLEEPETYDELLHIIDVLNENNVIPIALANQTKWPGAFYLMYFADRLAGPDIFNSAFARTGAGFDDPSFIRAGEYIQDLVQRDAFNVGFNGIPYDAGQGRQLLYSGQAAMMLIGNSFLNDALNEAPEFAEKLGFFKFPSLPDGEGDPLNMDGVLSPVFSGWSGTEHPDLVAELLKELTSLESAQAFADRSRGLTAINGVEYTDEVLNRMFQDALNAPDISWPYDQTLPPDLAQLHLDTTQALFGLEITPEEAARQMEELAKEQLD
ncbi:raffinose/stachyose/melibiose transport system substrate-binding protein [Evansella vedderi]|uniref:Raffinose/stachyose/melibiose transport system substrate-binding protein n=1 Tax=Evansella vedderi TaxID=38282 RepID=A0ABT9ZQN7_9BACI|nr:extracellular solute-binding protein [Evansella vedderi]MDQ0253164.1 raffinose/stachyose/melibiose transport system substrate-binding protein [Evansella vedderi]